RNGGSSGLLRQTGEQGIAGKIDIRGLRRAAAVVGVGDLDQAAVRGADILGRGVRADAQDAPRPLGRHAGAPARPPPVDRHGDRGEEEQALHRAR
ncbi:hypothetical protein D4M08_10300, partial [Campylobacter coli]